jgi:glycine betaine catabolism B
VIRPALIGGFAAALALIALRADAITAEEHASHHPGGGAVGAPGALGVASGGMGEMMGKMMAPAPAAAGPSAAGGMAASSGDCMGGDCGSGAAKTPIYPSLMTLPALTPEKRAEIDALASQQINEGMGRLATGAESLERAAQAGDYAAMQESVGLMREGLDELGAGIAARRVLSEGKAPRNLALDWFKREMNLASPIAPEEPRALLGVTPFHLFTMMLLIAFALAMVAMYFFKMRRAAALFGRLDSDSGSPPPGASPPLAGAPGPSAPVAPPEGKTPPPGGAPPPAAPTSPATPAAGTPAASAPSPGGSSAVPVSATTSASPLTANWRGQLRVGSIVMETPSVKTFRLLPSSNDSPMPFTFVPGQFLNVAFWIGGARMNRSYSISSSPTQRDYVELTVRREPRGAVSRHINDLLKVGDQIEAGGPVGRFTFTGTEADSIVLIAGGVGITPMMSITRYLTERSWAGDLFFIYTCRAPTDFIFANEVAALQRINPKLRVAVTMSRPEGTGWKGPHGRITKELLTQTVPNLAARRIHLCGPPSMMDSTKAILTELGVAPDQMKTEAFGATKPTPAAAGTTAKPTVPATGPLVTFSKNNKSAKIHIGQTVLELSEELAIGIENSCRVGTCGVCKVQLTAGEVEMAVEDALGPDDKANGIILACQAKPKSDIAVEA